MEIIVSITMVLILLSLFAVIREGRKGILRKTAGSIDLPEADWPETALIIPATGANPETFSYLASLASQDYPNYRMILVTESAHDPVVPAIRQLMDEYSHVGHVISGSALTCGQKNHNLLAGVKSLGPGAEILVFCDATRLAGQDFLKQLIWPLARGLSLVSSGYHQAIPLDHGISTLGMTANVLLLYMTRGMDMLMQPWGGGTAIKRSTFESLAVDRLWAENVVDDVSLAAHLKKAGVRVASRPGACMLFNVSGITPSFWSTWFTRQLLYLKFCFPGTWVASLLYTLVFIGLIYLSLFWVLAFPLQLVSWQFSLMGGLYLLTLALEALLLRAEHPCSLPAVSFVTAVFAALTMGGYCQLATLFTWSIKWRGISYRVGWQGKVTRIYRVGETGVRSVVTSDNHT